MGFSYISSKKGGMAGEFRELLWEERRHEPLLSLVIFYVGEAEVFYLPKGLNRLLCY